jgi:hypothetical protein
MVDRVSNVLPQVQVTCMALYAGCVFSFIVLSLHRFGVFAWLLKKGANNSKFCQKLKGTTGNFGVSPSSN